MENKLKIFQVSPKYNNFLKHFWEGFSKILSKQSVKKLKEK